MCSFRVFGNTRVGGGRRDDRSVFSSPPGLAMSVLTSVLVLGLKNKIVVAVATVCFQISQNKSCHLIRYINSYFGVIVLDC